MSVAKAIYSQLSTATAVTDIVDTRIYAAEAEEGGSYPRLVFDVSDDDRPRTYKGASGLLASTVSVACTALGYRDALLLAAAVRAALESGKATWGGVVVMGCFFKTATESRDDPEPGSDVIAYTRELTFSTWIQD
jgi:hypothetical protein